MREIKFRGRNETGWHDGLLTFMFRSYAISHVEDENVVDLIDKETVGQYTGLKDKNGVEIYEGDILNYGDYLSSHQVIFKNGCFWGHAIGYGENIGIGLYNALEDLEVVSNIHDNPELLEVAK